MYFHVHLKSTFVCLKYVTTLSKTPKYSLKREYSLSDPYCFEVFLPYMKCGQNELTYRNQAGGNG